MGPRGRLKASAIATRLPTLNTWSPAPLPSPPPPALIHCAAGVLRACSTPWLIWNEGARQRCQSTSRSALRRRLLCSRSKPTRADLLARRETAVTNAENDGSLVMTTQRKLAGGTPMSACRWRWGEPAETETIDGQTGSCRQGCERLSLPDCVANAEGLPVCLLTHSKRGRREAKEDAVSLFRTKQAGVVL